MQSYPFRLGELECASLLDNRQSSNLKEVFPTLSDADIQGTPDTFEVGFNCLYIKQGTTHILVDTGTGQGKLLESLSTIGLSAQDIDIVILTHGDRDHIGGVLNFPKAQFFLSQKMITSWTEPAQQDGMIEEFAKLFRHSLDEEALKARVQPRRKFATEILPQLKERLHPVAFEEEFLPGFKLLDATGHRSDHTALEISSGGETLIHLVDSLRHPLQIKYDLASIIDSYPDQLIASNKRLIERSLKTHALMFGSHLTFPGLARVSEGVEGLEWEWVK
jgi:glyoxylase-like metal-dependent hydrolase (beta-lactamase superfamily II)